MYLQLPSSVMDPGLVPKWRDVIDPGCPVKEPICLEEEDPFLSKILELRMTSCCLAYFQNTTPNISLTHPETIKTFRFWDRAHHEGPLCAINDGNARGLLLQIAPFVEDLEFDPIHLNNNILPGIQPFPKLRELHIGFGKNIMQTNLDILFSHQFPLLEGLYLCLKYSNAKLMDEAYVNLFSFLANHKGTLKRLEIDINFSSRFILLCDLPDSTLEIDLSKKVEVILSEDQLQLESLELSLPPKYFPVWIPIIASQQKLINLTVRYNSTGDLDPASFQFSGISPGILSSVSTLKKVILHALSPVTCDGLDWILLDLSVFRDAAQLTELELRGSCVRQKDHVGTLMPNENEGPWIINLDQINSRSLKSLNIHGFVCNSGELQILVDNSPVLRTLKLEDVIAPVTSDKYAESGVHGGIIKSFMEKESSPGIKINSSLNYEHAAQNEKLNEVKKLHYYPYDGENYESFELNVW